MLALPTAAACKPGALDRGFSGDGKIVTVFPRNDGGQRSINYVLPYEFAPGRIAMARGRGGRVVAANSKAIVTYLASGRRDPGFGGGGAVAITPIEDSRFQLADIVVDSQGRVLIAGTTKPTEEQGLAGIPVPGPLPTVATIRRYKANGQPDPSFGDEGVLSTDFGAPLPTFSGDGYPEFAGDVYPGSAVAVVGLAVDRADRPIVTGSAVVEVGRCGPPQDRYEASQAIVARLTVGGALDPSFAGDGTRSIGGLSWLGLPTPTSTGVLAAGSSANSCPRGGAENPSVLVNLGNDGSLNKGFAAGGFRSRPFTRVSDLAVTPAGKIVLLVRTIELSRGKWVESAGRVVQLRRDGALDPQFGRRGQAQLRLPRRGRISAIATDSQGRVLLAGNVRRKSRRTKRGHLTFLLIRTTPAGTVDRGFGRRGRAKTGFGARTNVRATDVLVDRANRITVGGKFSGPSSDNALALARYLGGR